MSNMFKQFERDQDGTVTIFAAVVAVGIIVAGGAAVDFMRHETMRSQIQYSADRAVLAAASLDQTQTPEAVVADYMGKSEIFGEMTYTSSSIMDSGTRSVKLDVTSTIDTYFIKMLGFEKLTAHASATAEETVQTVEISLVLDISEPMGEGLRLENMKMAAKDFVTSVFAESQAGSASISLIPFSGSVSLPDELAAEYNLTNEHNNSNCARFPTSMFDSTALSTSVSLIRQSHYDPTDAVTSPISAPLCPAKDAGKSIIPFSDSETELHTAIDGLTTFGETAIDLGMRWGTALLDPGTQGVVDNMINNASANNSDVSNTPIRQINPTFSGRPFDFDEDQRMKVIVVMVTGDVNRQMDIKPEYKSGASHLWVNDAGVYSAYIPSRGHYYVPTTGANQAQPEANADGSAAVNLSYPEVWNQFSVGYVADHFFRGQGDQPMYNAMRDAEESTIVGNSGNSRLHEMCQVAKDAGIVVFGVGFDEPSNVWSVMKTCTSTPSHFYASEGLDITNAFASIAGAIRKLKLTQ